MGEVWTFGYLAVGILLMLTIAVCVVWQNRYERRRKRKNEHETGRETPKREPD